MSAALERLPYVDEHAIAIGATPDTAWQVLLEVAESATRSPRAVHVARALGCADVEPAGPRPLAAGSAIVGFHVAAAERPTELALVGRHRFSEYALIFRLDDLGAGGTRLRAETRAAFPGLAGRAYRALVIGTRGHVLAVRRLLAGAKRRAERKEREGGS